MDDKPKKPKPKRKKEYKDVIHGGGDTIHATVYARKSKVELAR